jgi:heme/copper-type cytochrome/quinol oxidase subunit 2
MADSCIYSKKRIYNTIFQSTLKGVSFLIIVVLIVFFCLQGFVLFCCLAAGDDPGSQEVSDQEQMEYIEMWMEKRKRKAG